MNEEWYITSTVTAQTTIVFITSIYDVLKTQIWYFINVAVTLLIWYDNMPAIARDKVVTFAGDVLFERNLPTSMKPETTLGKRIDLRISGQLEVPHTQDEKAEKHLLFPA